MLVLGVSFLWDCSLFVLFPKQQPGAMAWDVSAIPGLQHAAFELCLSLGWVLFIKCQGTLLMWLHAVLVPEHTGIFPSTMEVLFLRQNCLL